MDSRKHSVNMETETFRKLSEEQKQKLSDYIESLLNSAKLKDGENHLVDSLSVGPNIDGGQEEIVNITEQIYFDMDTWDILLPIEPNNDKAVIEKVKSEIGKVQPSGFKLLTHYYPKDAEEQIDDIFAIIAALKSESKEGEQKWSTKASDYAEAFKQNPTNANFMQAMELTDEEWLNLPKEEILQLYKNCYGMLMQYVQGKDSREEIVKDFVDFLSDEGYDVPVHRSVIEKYLQSGEVKETKE
jgi:hypothetical protein